MAAGRPSNLGTPGPGIIIVLVINIVNIMIIINVDNGIVNIMPINYASATWAGPGIFKIHQRGGAVETGCSGSHYTIGCFVI